ncbi:amidohydrolase family protein, partial [Escherichia coli]|uniref:amidohydrolase family protein n=1 Tax=Escherichia coli TaxID=562 RepID=UPI003DA534CA
DIRRAHQHVHAMLARGFCRFERGGKFGDHAAKLVGFGNVAASELAQLGLLDILSSDYYPASLLDAAFRVADDESNRFTLPQAVKLVTKNPAQALNLQDRGVIGEGKRADLVLAHRKGNHIHIDHVWRQGKRVF